MIVAIFFILIIAGALGVVAAWGYRCILHKAKSIERGLKMVPLLIHLPPPSADTQAEGRDLREVQREKVSQAESMYSLIAGTAQEGFKSRFYGQRHIAFEVIATGGTIHFYAAVPVGLVPVIVKAILSSYPGARVEEAADHNVFNPQGKLIGTLGGELVLKADAAYPIATYKRLETDPMEAILNSVSALSPGDGAAVQLLLRPASRDWVKGATALVKKLRQGGNKAGFSPLDIARATVKAPGAGADSQPTPATGPTGLEQSVMEAVEDKTRYPGYEILIRLVASSGEVSRSQAILQNLVTAFSILDAPGLNGFKYLPAADVQGLATAFIFRFFPPTVNQNILSSSELATLFHLPDAQFTPVAGVERQMSKQVDGPTNVSRTGLLFGFNFFREVKKEIRLSPEDRRRHTYIVGQTGTGKSVLLENLAVQDMLAGNGFAFIDPHGDTAEKLISMVPKNRAEDVIYFNPGDTETPLGLNIFEFSDPGQKDFLIQEAIGMLYKLYDPGHTGIIGPRYEHWFRNAALTLMSDPNGSTFIEVPKVFTDMEYLKTKFKYVTDPTVIDFWTKEMAQTSDYHKSEMLGWFVSKFGAFMSNELMRNIIGQTQSAFNLREVMDQKKILIVNLSKGRVGDLNSQLLGMMLVIKIQAAAMSRANVPEDQRSDFSLYVDEFQNFSTDSFASILSEARKYHLNLIVANQFIGQLTPEIRDAVFGNVGSIAAFRVGPEDADFLVKQFAPVFDARDLVNLPNHNLVLRLMVGGLPSQPFTLETLPPLGISSPELGLAIKQLSAAKFGHPRAQVEAAILGRLANRPPVAPSPVAPVAAVATPLPTQPTATPAPIPALAVAPVSSPAPPPVAPVPVNPDLIVPSAPVPTPISKSAPDDRGTLKFADITRGIPDPTVKPTFNPLTPMPVPAAVPATPPVTPLPEPHPSPLVSAPETVLPVPPVPIDPQPVAAPAEAPAPPVPADPNATDLSVLSPWLTQATQETASAPFEPNSKVEEVQSNVTVPKPALPLAPIEAPVPKTLPMAATEGAAQSQPVSPSVSAPPMETPPELVEPTAPPQPAPDPAHLLVGVQPHAKRKRKRKRRPGAQYDAASGPNPSAVPPVTAGSSSVVSAPPPLPAAVVPVTAEPVQAASPEPVADSTPAPPVVPPAPVLLAESNATSTAVSSLTESATTPAPDLPVTALEPSEIATAAAPEPVAPVVTQPLEQPVNLPEPPVPAEATPQITLPDRERLADAVPPQPTEELETSTMLPGGEPAPEAAMAGPVGPKLQPGEVLVDDAGNVIIGE